MFVDLGRQLGGTTTSIHVISPSPIPQIFWLEHSLTCVISWSKNNSLTLRVSSCPTLGDYTLLRSTA